MPGSVVQVGQGGDIPAANFTGRLTYKKRSGLGLGFGGLGVK